jgi:hypothetical protein
MTILSKFGSRQEDFYVNFPQLLIQWTASQWLKLVDQKQRQWLDSYSLDKILSLKAIQTKKEKKSAKFSDISSYFSHSSIYLLRSANDI